MPSTSNKQLSQCKSAEVFIPDSSIHLLQHQDDDSFSTSSTVAVNDSSSPRKVVSTAARTAKSVHFDEERNISYCNTNAVLTKKDCANLWYNKEDYSHFETSTEFLATKIGRADERSTSPFSFEQVMLRLYGACCQCPCEMTDVNLLTLVEEAHLQHWMAESPGRLGLESLSIRPIDDDRIQRQAALVNLVVCELQEMKISSPIKKAEVIRQSCEVHSRPSRLLAMHLAKNWFHTLLI